VKSLPPAFLPEHLRPWRFTFAQGTEMSGEAFACLDCGLVWSSTSAEKLREFIRKYCDQKNDKPGS